MSRKDELLEIDTDEPDMLHATLSKMPKPLNLEALIGRTMQVYKQYPPKRLPGRSWARVSANSVLKTTENPEQLSKQTLQDGERLFERHALEIQRAQDKKKLRQRVMQVVRRYRRPAVYTGGALLIAFVAYQLNITGFGPGLLAGRDLLVPGLQQRAATVWVRVCSYWPRR